MLMLPVNIDNVDVCPPNEMPFSLLKTFDELHFGHIPFFILDSFDYGSWTRLFKKRAQRRSAPAGMFPIDMGRNREVNVENMGSIYEVIIQ